MNDLVFGVGQINSMISEELAEAKEILKPYLPKAMNENGVQMIFFMLTDIVNESTELLYYGKGAKRCLQEAYDLQEDSEKLILKGVVSRKKQLIPTLVTALQH